jgi:hypothetical protein
MEGNKVVMLKIDIESELGYTESVIMQEDSGKIATINGDKHKLYILVNVDNQLDLKIYQLDHGDFVFKSQIDDVGATNPEFTKAFQIASIMTRDCLIQDSNMITRIYDGDYNAIPSL